VPDSRANSQVKAHQSGYFHARKVEFGAEYDIIYKFLKSFARYHKQLAVKFAAMGRREVIDFGFNNIEFDIIALHTTLDAPKMAWQADMVLGTSFTLYPKPFEAVIGKNTSKHERYFCSDSEKNIEWWMIDNKGSGGYLYEAKPIPDILIVVRGDDNDETLTEWPSKLREIKGVHITYLLPEQQKKKAFWISDLRYDENDFSNTDF
jgi:hypothetical protein